GPRPRHPPLRHPLPQSEPRLACALGTWARDILTELSFRSPGAQRLDAGRPYDDDRQMDGLIRGQLVGGKYRIDGVLGLGGMGLVVAATHLHLRQQVALKFLLPDQAKDASSVARFLREA